MSTCTEKFRPTEVSIYTEIVFLAQTVFPSIGIEDLDGRTPF